MYYSPEDIEKYFARLRKSNKKNRQVTWRKLLLYFNAFGPEKVRYQTELTERLNLWRGSCVVQRVPIVIEEKWMYDNIVGLWNTTNPYRNYCVYYFENEDDALLFKMRWG